MDYAQSGSLVGFDEHDIADAAEWDGDAVAFTEALIETRFIDKDSDGIMSLHDWDDYAGKLMERRERVTAQSKKRVENYRKRQKPVENKEKTECNADVTRYNEQCNASETECNAPTVPNPTVPNLTKDNDSSSNFNAHTRESVNPELGAAMTAYMQEIESIPPAMAIEGVQYYLDEGMSSDVLIQAFRVAAAKRSRNWTYINGILKKWKVAGVISLADVAAYAERFENARSGTASGGARASPQEDNVFLSIMGDMNNGNE
ncbi:MAG: DnaD domain protein [Oscillospiraceae bacterium]|nr:DnaD domain protein [Oscillospiraceae bacterium]